MNKTICVVCLSACLGVSSAVAFAQTNSAAVPTNTPATTKTLKARKAATPVPVAAIPKGAVKTPEGAYRYKDPQGKTWLYRETPFGLSRVEEMPRTASSSTSVQTPFGPTKVVPASASATPRASQAEKPAAGSTAQITAVAKGDVIYFQKPTPFGKTSWQKSKNDLTPEEQKVWDREQANAQNANTQNANTQNKETR